MRIVIQQFAIFVLPLLLYAAYMLWRRRQARLTGQPEPAWERGHWYWAIVAGLVLSILVFIGLAVLTPHDPNAPFRPPSAR